MASRSSLLAVLLTGLVGPLSGLLGGQTDFNVVGREMAGLLETRHCAGRPIDGELSTRILQGYLTELDPNRHFFTAEDVEKFGKKYGSGVHEALAGGRCMQPAREIYERFRLRIREHHAYARSLLTGAGLSFERDDFVLRSRRKADWPANREALEALWEKRLTGDLLTEMLRHEEVARLAKQRGNENPFKEHASPIEKISARCDRLLQTAEKADEEDIANAFLSSVARAYDPHTDYMSAREMDRFRSGMTYSPAGIGALLRTADDGSTIIAEIIAHGPTHRNGRLRVGDRIVGVDAANDGTMTDIVFMGIEQVVELIRGLKGTHLRLMIEPATGAPGETDFAVITRARVLLGDERARAEIVVRKPAGGQEHRIAWLTLDSLYVDFDDGDPSVSKDVEKLLTRIAKERVDGIILDLRGNWGGSMAEAQRIAGFFLGNRPVLQLRKATGKVEVHSSSGTTPIYDGPLTVMTDRFTTNAGEVLAAALQDYHRAIIVGDSSTFGKGTTQKPLEITRLFRAHKGGDRSGYLRASVMMSYRATGSSIQLRGVRPDIVLPSLMDVLEFGEAHLSHPLPHDHIRLAPGFQPLADTKALRETLAARSGKRITASQDYAYIRQDAARIARLRQTNRSPLNRKGRLRILRESEKNRITRHKECRERFARIQATDRKEMQFFRLALQDLGREELEELDREKDFNPAAVLTADGPAALDPAPPWPSGLDPATREGLEVVADLIELGQR